MGTFFGNIGRGIAGIAQKVGQGIKDGAQYVYDVDVQMLKGGIQVAKSVVTGGEVDLSYMIKGFKPEALKEEKAQIKLIEMQQRTAEAESEIQEQLHPGQIMGVDIKTLGLVALAGIALFYFSKKK